MKKSKGTAEFSNSGKSMSAKTGVVLAYDTSKVKVVKFAAV